MKQLLQPELTSHFRKTPKTLFVPVLKNEDNNQLLSLSEKFKIPLEKIQNRFQAKSQQIVEIHPNTLKSPDSLVLIGLGEQVSFPDFELSIRKYIHSNKYELSESIGFDFAQQSFHEVEKNTILSLIEAGIRGLNLGLYELGMLKTKNSVKDKFINYPKTSILIREPILKEAKKCVHHATIISETQKKVFDLLNLPGNYVNSSTLAAASIESGKEFGYKVTVLNKAEIEKEGLGALLAVNKGSKEPPTLSILEYKPKGNKKVPKVGLVGKGVTFDTGGLSLKTAAGMYFMKSDMGGAAAVLGAVEVAAKLKLPVHLIGIIPATDNKTGADAIQPGDVITSYSGITIEVENTDAEGRLILADGIHYMNKYYNPDILIDLATLTGACVQSLGYEAAGLFTNNDDLAQRLANAGEDTSERVWRLPIWDAYHKQIESDIADVKNLGGPAAGAITAAKFIQYFTEDHPCWAHLDIAGTAFGRSPFSKGMIGTAFGVRLLTSYLENISKKQ